MSAAAMVDPLVWCLRDVVRCLQIRGHGVSRRLSHPPPPDLSPRDTVAASRSREKAMPIGTMLVRVPTLMT